MQWLDVLNYTIKSTPSVECHVMVSDWKTVKKSSFSVSALWFQLYWKFIHWNLFHLMLDILATQKIPQPVSSENQRN